MRLSAVLRVPSSLAFRSICVYVGHALAVYGVWQEVGLRLSGQETRVFPAGQGLPLFPSRRLASANFLSAGASRRSLVVR